MEGKQKRGGEIEEERSRRRSIKAGETEPAMIFSMTEETTTASADDNRAYSNRGS